jgi:uncharacterized protein YdaU (DUF1376 family)
VNYYERHIGDFTRDTAHLTALEVGVYDLLLDRYYATRQPIPKEMVYRIARAVTKADRSAVDLVLKEFFQLDGDSYRQRRCDAEIEKYQQTEPEREAKRANAAERQRRTRERRSELFDSLRSHGIVPDYDTPTGELVTLLSRAEQAKVTPVTRDVTRDVAVTSTPVTRDVTATRHQTPDTIPNIPPDGGKARKRARAALGAAFLADIGVPETTARDWLAVRERKRAPLTQTAWAGMEREAARAAITPAEAVRICAERGWIGFNADWDWRGGGNVRQLRPGNSEANAAANAEAKRLLGFAP